MDRKAIVLVAIVVAVAWGDILLLGRGFYRSDIISYHYPMKSAVRQVVERGEMPYWNRLVSAGQPLAANPAYEVWYPPQWLVFLPSFHYGMQLHIVLHFFLAAIGMYLLLRSLDLSMAASIFGALSFAFCGPYLSLSSRLPLLFSLSWMPLVLYFVRTSRFALASLAIAMQLLIGEPTIVIQTWLLIAAYVLWRRSFRHDLPRIALMGVVSVLIAAIQLLPGIDFARDTARAGGFPFVIASNWSLPFVRPIELLLPSLFTNLKTEAGATLISTMYPYRTEAYLGEIYLGMLVVLIALAGFFIKRRGRAAALALFAVFFVLALGAHTPLFKLLYNLHLTRSIRYPEKFIIAGAFVLIVWAAMLFEELRENERLARFVTVLASLAALLMAFAAVTGDMRYWVLNLVRAAVVIALMGPLRTRLKPGVWQAAVIACTAIDLYATMQSVAPRMPRSFFQPLPLVATLPKSNDYRFFHEAAYDRWDNKPELLQKMVGTAPEDYWRNFWAGLFPNLLELYGRPQALEEDIDQTALKPTSELIETLKRTRLAGDIPGELQLLRQANVRWRIRTSPTDLVMVDEIPPSPRYAFAEGGEVRPVDERDNTIRLTTRNSAAGRLVISVTAHKYWRATIDGRPATLLPANVAYQALDVPAGTHTIELRYRNPLILTGAVITLLTLLALIVVQLVRGRTSAREQ